MTPDERQLIANLFQRIRNASPAPRDSEAEAFIATQVQAQPDAPYHVVQAVLVQEHALGAANARLQQLESEVQALRQQALTPTPQAPAGGGSFLGGLGASLFGSQPQQAGTASRGPWGAPAPAPTSAQPQGPWGAPAPQTAAGGSSFLQGALTTAAGVAGGMLVADSIRSLFSPHLGMGAGLGGFGGMGAGFGGGETIVNNFYGTPDQLPAPDHAPSDLDSGFADYDDDTTPDTSFDDTSSFDV